MDDIDENTKGLMWAVYFGFLWNLAADHPAAHNGIQQSWIRFGAAFQDALLELYPEANSDPVIALIWTQPSA